MLQVVRGKAAWEAIQAANMFNDPPPEGMEYLLVKLHVRCTYDDKEQHSISTSDFKLTGDHLTLYPHANVVEPDPELDADLYKGGETTGWVAFLLPQEEGDLILIVDEVANWDEDRFRFIALEENTSIAVDSSLKAIKPNKAGLSREEPAAIGETVITEDWEITVLEVLRGEAAWQAIKAADKYSDPPEEGREYVVAKIAARNISIKDIASEISGNRFRATGSANVLYEHPWESAPKPPLDADLFPGGKTEGWVIAQVAVGESDIMLRFAPLFDFTGENTRFLALEKGASVTVDASLAKILPNDAGRSREEPAALGETAITEDWEFAILEVIRGEQAWERVQIANRYNDPPDEGMEYVLVKMRARYIGTEDAYKSIREGHCKLTGAENELYEVPSVVDPEPAFGLDLYPGGESTGWMTLEAKEGEADLVLVVTPSYSRRQTRYLALE